MSSVDGCEKEKRGRCQQQRHKKRFQNSDTRNKGKSRNSAGMSMSN